MFLYSSIKTKIELAVTKSQQIAQAGIGTVCKNCDINGTSIAIVCSNNVQIIPIVINQLLLSGTEKAERLSLRQLKTWIFWMKTIRHIT